LSDAARVHRVPARSVLIPSYTAVSLAPDEAFSPAETTAIMGRIHTRGDRLMAWFVL